MFTIDLNDLINLQTAEIEEINQDEVPDDVMNQIKPVANGHVETEQPRLKKKKHF